MPADQCFPIGGTSSLPHPSCKVFAGRNFSYMFIKPVCWLSCIISTILYLCSPPLLKTHYLLLVTLVIFSLYSDSCSDLVLVSGFWQLKFNQFVTLLYLVRWNVPPCFIHWINFHLAAAPLFGHHILCKTGCGGHFTCRLIKSCDI